MKCFLNGRQSTSTNRQGRKDCAHEFDDMYEMKVRPFQLLSNGVMIVGTGKARQITEKTPLKNYEAAIHELTGIDPLSNERKDITAV